MKRFILLTFIIGCRYDLTYPGDEWMEATYGTTINEYEPSRIYPDYEVIRFESALSMVKDAFLSHSVLTEKQFKSSIMGGNLCKKSENETDWIDSILGYGNYEFGSVYFRILPIKNFNVYDKNEKDYINVGGIAYPSIGSVTIGCDLSALAHEVAHIFDMNVFCILTGGHPKWEERKIKAADLAYRKMLIEEQSIVGDGCTENIPLLEEEQGVE